ncbi:MAG: LytR/AlgR family response regulator transcription factor [Gemmatimonadales bacterium]
MRTRVAIVDDERPARLRVRRLLEQRGGLEVVGEADSGPAAVELVRSHTPELLFLDLQMPGCGGFEALRSLAPAERPVVVFVTGFDVVALDLLEASAVSYLLKPYPDDDFADALRGALESLAGPWQDLWHGRLRSLLARSAGPHYLERFAVRHDDRVRFLPSAAVGWIEAAADYVLLHGEDTIHTIRTTMQALDDTLRPDEFVRVHRSHIVRADRVDYLEPHPRGEDVLVLRDRTRVKVGRTYREAVRGRFGAVGALLAEH